MSLYENWMKQAYDKKGKLNKAVWEEYSILEQKIYETLLKEETGKLKGTIKELGARFHMSCEYICSFLEGINEVNETPLEIDKIEEDSFVTIEVDFEKLYKKMIEFGAEHLYKLPEWDNIFDEETRERFYYEQKTSKTYVREEKLGRNDPCNCGSGKKYKKCCGA